MYVEDERNTRNELYDVLTYFAHDVYVAEDGAQGVELFARHRPKIVISDIRMPQMSGIEMAKAIRAIDQQVHIVFLSAFSDTPFLQEAIELQASGYLLKPIDLELLEQKLLSIIEHIALKAEVLAKEQMLIQQSKLASMGEMISNITHQWKQPLSIISVATNNMRVDFEMEQMDKTQFERYIHNITTQVGYLAKTIEDFQTFFKPSTDLHTHYNLKKFLDKCIELVESSFVSASIETIRHIDSSINSFGDPNQLSQALINILNNAKDVLKEAQGVQEKLVFIVLGRIEENRLMIEIKDNAGGIDEELLERVFEPYFTTKESGTGLGLYITHTIITKNLGGSIDVSNETFEYEGKIYTGAKFTILLPHAP